MSDKFILVRKERRYTQDSKWPKVRISADTYEKLSEWAGETGLTLSSLIGQTVKFADEHRVFIDE